MILNLSLLFLGGSLIAWQLWSESKKSYILAALSLLGLAAVGFSLFLNNGLSFKNLGLVSVSLLCISACSFIASNLRKLTILKLPFLALSLFVIFQITHYFQPNSTLPTDIDPNAEILVKVDHQRLDDFRAFAQKSSDFTISPAFQVEFENETELDDYFAINLLDDNPNNQLKVIKSIQNRPEVKSLEFNEIIQLPDEVSTYKTTNTNNQYLFQDPLNQDQWALNKTNINDLYKLIQNAEAKKKARLFILDTGVDSKHEDLKDVFVSTSSSNDKDVKGHGTHCAGIAGALTGNNIGISSFNAEGLFEISSIKVLSDFGGGTQQGIINGMINAIDMGADVVSMSLGGRSSDSRQKAYEDVIKYADRKNVIFIVAAGNASANAKFFSPANSKGVITVGAVDENLNRASFSNSLEDIEMGISAPGVNILSTFPNSKYQTFSGTSMATPFIAGLVSLMKCYEPELTTKEAFELLAQEGFQTSSIEIKNIVNPAGSLEKLLKK